METLTGIDMMIAFVAGWVIGTFVNFIFIYFVVSTLIDDINENGPNGKEIPV